MGQLATAFQSRISTQRLVELTNPDAEAAITVNATLLAAAESSAINEFFLLTGIAFDTTYTDANSAYQVECGIYGIYSKLYDYRGLPRSQSAESARAEWLDLCSKYNRVVGSLAWQSPLTNSGLTPSADVAGSLPYFDRKMLESLVPRSPQPGADDNPWPAYGQ